MAEQKDNSKLTNRILGYGFMLEKSMISEFKRIYPGVILRDVEHTERPTIDISEYPKKPSRVLNTNSEGFSFFRAEPGFKPKIKVPSGRKIISFLDEEGKIRYKYED
jgi:hypothetical protein